jgi:glycosyltransferase involved in cell wall biosynthesis
MTQMRIVEVVGNGYGGGTQCLAHLVQHLDSQRFAVTMVAPQAPWLAEVCDHAGAIYHPLALLEHRLDAQKASDLSALIAHAQADIVHCHGTRAAWFSIRALLHADPRPALIYSEHLFAFDARTGIKRLPWLAIERYICRHADALTTSSSANAELAIARGWIAPDRIAVRHYGIDQEAIAAQAKNPIARAAIGLAPDVPVVGTVARLVPQKGMHYWLEAAAMVARELPTAHFVVIGDGELRAELEQQAQRLGLARQMLFLGNNTTPWRILAACDIVAFSSLYEGLPLTGLEALAAGMPTIMTRLPGTEEIVRSKVNGMLVAPRSAAQLADAMLLLLRNPSLQAILRAAGPASITEYRAEMMVADFRALYERLYAERDTRLAAPRHAPTRARHHA